MVYQINGDFGGYYISSGSGADVETSDEPVKKKSEMGNIHDEYKKFREEQEKEYNEYVKNTNEKFKVFRDNAEAKFEEFYLGKEQEFGGSSQKVKSNRDINQRTTGLPIEEIPHLEKDENGNLVSNYYDSKGNLIKSVPYKTEPAVNAQSGEKSVETGLPIEEVPHLEKDENGNFVVNYYDGDGNLVKSTPYKSTVEEVQNSSRQSSNDTTLNQDPDKSKVQPRAVQADGVKGTYILTEGENGKGFSLKQNMSVSLINSEVKDFFFPNNREITQSSDGTYEYRGIKSKNFSALQNRIMLTAQRTAMNNAVYQDLLQRQKSGVELTDAEKSFMNQYKGSLASYGLGVDDNGKLFDLKE